MRKTKGDTKIMKVRKIKTAMCAFGLGVMMLAGTVTVTNANSKALITLIL